MLGEKKKAEQSLKGKRMACNLRPKLTTSPSHRNIHKKSSHQAQTSDKKKPRKQKQKLAQKKTAWPISTQAIFTRENSRNRPTQKLKTGKHEDRRQNKPQNQYTCNWTYLQAPSSVAAFPFSTATRYNTTRHGHRLPTCTCTSVKAKTKVEKKKKKKFSRGMEAGEVQRRKPLNLVGDCLYENQENQTCEVAEAK